MKLVIVGPAYPLRGGIAQYTGSLAEALNESGHDASIVSFSRQYPGLLFPGGSQLDPGEYPFSTPVEAVLDSVNPLSWARTARRINRRQPDVVVVQWWHPFFGPCLGSVLARLGSVRLLLCHNLIAHETARLPVREWIERQVVRRVLARVDAAVAHSDQLLETVCKLRPQLRTAKIFHPAYDFYSRWDSGAGDGQRQEPYRLLFFGNIRRYKGLDILLESVAKLKERLPFQLVIAGESYVDPLPLEKQIDDLGLRDFVEWRPGYVCNEDVPALFRSTDLLVLPYRTATQSGIIPLAYQFGVPVVATDVGGLSEVVLPGKTGALAAPENPVDLAEKIEETLRSDADYRNDISRMCARLSWDIVVDTILDLVKALKRES